MTSAHVFTQQYREMYPRVLGYALRRADAEQARDVADETFLVAWRRRSEIPGDVLPWLLVTARHILADQRRCGNRRDVVAAELALFAPAAAEGADVAAVERIAVLTALSSLTDRDRDLLMLTVWDGLSMRQAAAVLGCGTSALGVRLYRARKRFRAALDVADDTAVVSLAGRPSLSKNKSQSPLGSRSGQL